jgi:hypothetical protein
MFHSSPSLLLRCCACLLLYLFAKYLLHQRVKKGHPITGHQGPRGGVQVQLYSFSTSALVGGGWSAPRPGRFTRKKDPVPIVQEAWWAQGRSGRVEKFWSPPGFDSRTVQPVASRYTDWATRPTYHTVLWHILIRYSQEITNWQN